MEQRIVTNYERALTTTVNDIEHIESQSLSGLSVIKIFFQAGAHIEAATAQVTAISQTVVRMMPTGTTPPFIIRYSASNVPIMQTALGSESLSEQQLFDYQLHPRRHGYGSWCSDPLAIRRQTAPCVRRHRPGEVVCLGAIPKRCDQCRVGTKSRFADRIGKNGVE